MPRIAVLDDYQGVARQFADWDQLGPDCEIDIFREALVGEDEAAKALAPYDIVCLMRERMPLRGSLIARLPNLKLVVFTGARTRSVDFDAAAAHGVTVCGTPRTGSSHGGTPELAWGLILACARHIPQEHQRVREGGWQQTVGLMLDGATLGIVGLGRLGSNMAAIARAFGMKVIAWSPNLTPERAAAGGAELVSKNELFARSDVITIHMVLSDTTRGLVGAEEIAAMKPSAILVNTSRGPLVDEAALIAALESGRIRAGLDVYNTEPLPRDHPMRRVPNAVLTPHLGYVTESGYRDYHGGTVKAILAWRAGAPENVWATPAG